MKTTNSRARKVQSVVLSAILALSLVPSTALASSVYADGASASFAEGTAVSDASPEVASEQGQGAQDDEGFLPASADDASAAEASADTVADTSGSSGHEAAGADTAESSIAMSETGAGTDSGASVDSPVQDAIASSDTGVADEGGVDAAIAYGCSVLLAASPADEASGSEVADPSNPAEPVKIGQYKPGTYTVTANVFIPKALNPLIDVQAYAANPKNPLNITEPDNGTAEGEDVMGIPDSPMLDNATLVVAEDGTLTLTIPIRNPVFTLQQIGNGEGVEVESVHTRAGQYGPMGANGVVARVDHDSRIDSVTFKITGDSGYTSDGSHGYTLQGSKEYPTLVGQNWSVPLSLTMDLTKVPAGGTFASDPAALSDLTYAGVEQQGVSYDADKTDVVSGDVAAVNAGDYAAVLKPKDGFTWLDGTTDERSVAWSIAKAPLVKKYETIIAPGDTTNAQDVVDKLPSADEVNAHFTYEGLVNGETPESVEGLETQTFDSWDLGYLQYAISMPSVFPLSVALPLDLTATYAGQNADTANYTVTTEAVAHVGMSAAQMPEAYDVVYTGQHQLGLRQADGTAWYATSAESPLKKFTPWDDFTQGAFLGLRSRSYVNVGAYTVSLSPSLTWNFADGYWNDGTNAARSCTFHITPATLTAKARDVYIVAGDVPVLSVDVTGFVNGESAGDAAGYTAPAASLPEGVNALTVKAGETYPITVSGGTVDNYTFAYEGATLHVLDASVAAVPQVNDGLVYNGRDQQGVTPGAGYTLSGATQKDAGTYTATATLDEGFTSWADGSTERERTFTWEIAKATLTASYAGEMLDRNAFDNGQDRPTFHVQVTGFVNGEDPENGTVADYRAPELYVQGNDGNPSETKASDWKPGHSVEDSFIPAGGEARNYTFDYVRGSVWAFTKEESNTSISAVLPNVYTGMPYTGREQVGVVAHTGSSIVGSAVGTDAGSYSTMIALDDGFSKWYNINIYWHGDNAAPVDSVTPIIQAQWHISKAPLTAKVRDLTITAGDVPEFAVDTYGFVNGESADTATGFEAPSVSLPEGVTADTLQPGYAYQTSASGGGAKNYEYTAYESGTLIVLPKGTVADPTVAQDLVYNGAEQQAVKPNEAWTVEGGSATDAGDYTATVTLNDGYVWADGTSERTKTLAYSIAKAPLTATYAGETVVKGQAPALAVDVTGFVGADTPATAAGYVAPKVSLPGGIEPGDLEAGASYDLTPTGGEAANYTFVYVGGKLSVSSMVPGTYQVTANLSMPGRYNPVITGLTVYANSPDNPFGPVIDGNDPAEVDDAVPSTPESMNATLVIGSDGTKTLVLPIKNPVFTTQDLGTCADLTGVEVERTAPADAATWTYGKYDMRISRMKATLPDRLTTGTASYTFTGSTLYAVPLDLDLKPAGDVALTLEVDYTGMNKVSDSTQVPTFNTGGTDNPGGEGGQGGNQGGNEGGGQTPGGNQGGNQGGGTGGVTPGGNQGGQTGGAAVPGGQGNQGTPSSTAGGSGHIAAGTYTVSANIWLSREDTGLPLNPHFTNSAFPPMNPVADNATLTVDDSGRAQVTVPIVIMAKIMKVKSISGLAVTNSSSADGGLTSVTVDLGVLDAGTSVVTRSCTASVEIGDLAMTIGGAIFGGERTHTYPATFQVNFSGLPASGGGRVPDSVRQMMAAAGVDGSGAGTASAEAAAAEAAEAAAAEARAKDEARSNAPKSGSANAADDAAEGLEAVEEQLAANPLLTFGLGVVCTLVVGGAAAGGVHAYRRRKAAAAAGGAPKPPAGA